MCSLVGAMTRGLEVKAEKRPTDKEFQGYAEGSISMPTLTPGPLESWPKTLRKDRSISPAPPAPPFPTAATKTEPGRTTLPWAASASGRILPYVQPKNKVVTPPKPAQPKK